MPRLLPDRVSQAALVFALAMVCYTANGRTIGSGDTLPARFLPYTILRHGSFFLDDFPFLYAGDPYWVRNIGGHYVSFYPVGPGIAAIPFYLPAVLRSGVGPSMARAEELEKLAAASLVALSVALLYAALRRKVDRASAASIAFAYALGTSSLSVSSQGLWQHGPGQLGIAAGIYWLVRAEEESTNAVAWAGLALVFAVACRPTNALLVVPLTAYVLWIHPRRFLAFVAAALPVVSFQLWYNVRYLHDPLATQFPVLQGDFWSQNMRGNLAGLLLSPTRGLFVYSPVLVFSTWGAAVSWRSGGDRLARALGIGALLVLAVHARWRIWYGGATYGPRLLADTTPALAYLLFPFARVAAGAATARMLFGLALVWSIAAHAIGAYGDDGSWNNRLPAVGRYPEVLWSWSNNQLAIGMRGVGQTASRWLGLPQPIDRDEEEQLRTEALADARHDGAFIALRALYVAAGASDQAAAIEAERARRFTPQHRLDWRFDDELELVGIDWAPAGPRDVEITFYWRAFRWLTGDYAAFTRLSGAGCARTEDYWLGGPDLPSRRWPPGATIRQTQRLSLDSLPERGCALRLGVWVPGEKRHVYLRRWPFWKRSDLLLTLRPSAAGIDVAIGGG
jgi:hypothetical protein